MRRVCTGALVHGEQTVRDKCGQARVEERRDCIGAQVHCEHTIRERVWPGQGGGSGECA